jgi:hypothetical protein
MDASEIELIRESLRNLLATHAAQDVPAELLRADWLELLEAEPRVAIAVLAEEQGRSLSGASALDLVLQHAAGLPVDANRAFVLPPLRRGFDLAAGASHSALRIDGLLRGGRRSAAKWIVPAPGGLVSLAGDALRLDPVRGFDPEIGLVRISGEVPTARCTYIAEPDPWQRALAAGRRSLASELVGLTDRMLTDAVDYVGARKQFGRALGSFQAVKHRLADVRVALGAARAAIEAAWDAGDAISAIAAKILAARAHRLASTHCHQVLGGIAFTVEHGFHRLIQRGYALDALLGPADELTKELGRRIIDLRRVPRVPQLVDACLPETGQ